MKHLAITIFILIITSSCISKKPNLDKLSDFVATNNIENMKLIVVDKEIDLFSNQKIISEFQNLKRVKGPWKFKKSLIIIANKDNKKDTILTNGVIFLYKNKYFMKHTKENILLSVKI